MATAGPNTAGTGADGGGLDAVWGTPENITASDNAYATAFGVANSNRLQATNFGFAVPAGATIGGIVVEWERKASADTTISDVQIRIIKGGTVGATDKSSVTQWTAAEGFFSYGSSGDLWGETWTVANINASDFGAALVCNCNSATASVDSCRITVTYTAAGLAGSMSLLGVGK